jgi:hypothetical protein
MLSFIDPAVQTGLLIYEIRPWLTVMEHYDGASMK